MNKKNFEKLIAGMDDALAYARGDTSRGVAHVVESVDVAGIRKSLRLSQGQFATRFGLDRSAVQQWEQGRRQPERSARILLRVIEAYPDIAEEAAKKALGA